jgi:hypothetical protein
MQRASQPDPTREPWITDLTVEQRLALLDELDQLEAAHHDADSRSVLDRWSGVAARNLARLRLRELHRAD